MLNAICIVTAYYTVLDGIDDRSDAVVDARCYVHVLVTSVSDLAGALLQQTWIKCRN